MKPGPAAREWVTRHPSLALWLLAVAVRVPVAIATTQPGIDEALMFGYGSSWLRTGTYDGIQWPVPYVLLVGSLGMTVGARLAVELIYVLVGSLAVVPLFLGMAQLRGRAAAAWGAAGVALLPAVGVGVNKSGSHSLYLPLLGLAFLLHVRALAHPKPRRLLVLGAALGAAYVTRTDGLVVLAVVTLSMGLPRAPLPERLRRMLLVGAGSLLFVLPNVLHVHHHLGRWAFSAHVATLVERPNYLLGLKDARLAEMTDEFQAAPGAPYAKLLTHPGYVARKVGYNTRLFLRALGDVYVFPAILFGLLGLVIPSFLRDFGRGALLLAAWASPSLAFLALNIEPRYFSPMAMFLMLFTGEGWVRLAELCGERRLLLRAIAIGVLAFLLACNAMVTEASRAGDQTGIADRARVVLEETRDRLGVTFVLNPHLRFAIDGRVGGPRSAPVHDAATSRILVVDPASQESEREWFERLRGTSAFRDWTAGGLEFHERLE